MRDKLPPRTSVGSESLAYKENMSSGFSFLLVDRSYDKVSENHIFPYELIDL